MNFTLTKYAVSKSPLVSIMIPVYNQITEFQKAVQSARDQDYENIEIIICDDASKDGDLQQIVNRWNDPRIKYYRNEVNLGMHGNFLRLLNELSSGEIATKIDADDYFTDPSLVRQVVSLFESDDEISIVFGKVNQLIISSGQIIEDHQNDSLELVNDGSQLFYNYANGLTFPHTGTFYHRQLALDYGCYTHRAMSEDWESFLRMSFARKVAYIDRPIAMKTLHSTNFTKKIKPEHFKSHSSYVDSIYEKMKDHPDMDSTGLKKWYDKMRKRHHSKWLIKLWNLDRKIYYQYEKYLQEDVPDVWDLLRKDIRFIGYNMIKRSPFLMRLAFKYILKQPSFIEDLHQNQ